MNALGFAWRSLIRQPARATLGVLGVAAVGALLLDMLLLSQGLIVSMRDLLDRSGWDIRVSAGELPGRGGRVGAATSTADRIAALPSVKAALIVRIASARVERSGGPPIAAAFEGISGRSRRGESITPPWTVLRGRDAQGEHEVVIDDAIATAANLAVGATITLRTSCISDREALPPATLTVVGIAEFPFAGTNEDAMGGSLDALRSACGGNVGDEADVLLVTSVGEPRDTVAAIRAAVPHLHALTNDEVVGRLQQTGFTYFRQISAVLTTVTVSFAVLLITVLLTVSVNQRLGEIAALRALGFSRSRVIADVLSESALIVGAGGLLSLPLGLLLSTGLDRILKGMPGIPAALHFFVFEETALGIHIGLLAATAVIAALYPMRIVSGLPIAATLRDEVIG
jgi:ABC-type lipoprotein release transport system permease subunit